jgi:hypothetical protein
MLGFDTTMKGKFRSDWMRCARRAGKIRRVKLADARSCAVVRGERPCLLRHDTALVKLCEA